MCKVTVSAAIGPVYPSYKTAVQVVLNLPDTLSPEMFVCVGYAAPKPQGGMSAYEKVTTWRDLTYWDRFEDEG